MSRTYDPADLVDEKEACRILGGISHSTLRRGIKSGKYPAPIPFGDRHRLWLRSELLACVDRLMKER